MAWMINDDKSKYRPTMIETVYTLDAVVNDMPSGTIKEIFYRNYGDIPDEIIGARYRVSIVRQTEKYISVYAESLEQPGRAYVKYKFNSTTWSEWQKMKSFYANERIEFSNRWLTGVWVKTGNYGVITIPLDGKVYADSLTVVNDYSIEINCDGEAGTITSSAGSTITVSKVSGVGLSISITAPEGAAYYKTGHVFGAMVSMKIDLADTV